MFKNFLNKFKARWDGFSSTQKRFFLLSFFLSLSTLAVLEVVIRWYGGDPTTPLLPLPPFIQVFLPRSFGSPEFLTVRQTGVLIRILLLVLWSYYVSYRLAVRPVLSTATSTYQELRKTLPVSLAVLRAFRISPEFKRVVVVLASVTTVVLVFRWGSVQGVGFNLFLWVLAFIPCYFEFKAGHYPGSEQEFWGEVAEASSEYGKQLGRVAALSIGIAALANAGVAWYDVYSNKQLKRQELEFNKQLKQQELEFNKQLKQQELESNNQLKQQELDYKNRKLDFKQQKWSAAQVEQNKQNIPPTKWF